MPADNLRNWRLQLQKAADGSPIITSGGKAMVVSAGTAQKVALKDSNGAAASNPVSITRGQIDFWVASSTQTVDLYIMAPGGQFAVHRGVTASGPNDLFIDTIDRRQVAVIPFYHGDKAGDATETDTGFDLPDQAIVMGRKDGNSLLVKVADAAETIQVGTLSSESGGDADGFMTDAATSVGTAGTVMPSADGALVGSDVPYRTDAQTAKSISWTLTAGSDTAEGFIFLNYQLNALAAGA